MNGPIQTKTKGVLLLQFHPSPRLPVCVYGASLVRKERKRSRFNFITRGGQMMKEKGKNKEKEKL